MTRTEFIFSLAGAVGSLRLNERYLVTSVHAKVDHSKGIRVFVNGMEVTKRCWQAYLYSDGTVEAECHLHNEQGEPYVDPENPRQSAREVVVGPGRIDIPSSIAAAYVKC